MLQCRDISEMATEFSESALPWPRRASMLLHLAYCSACRAYMDQLAKTRRLLRDRPLAPLPPAQEAALLDSLCKPD